MAEHPLPPLPQPGPDTLEFWEGCRRHELRIQRCADCGRARFAPRPSCPHCGALRFDWFTAKGTGRVHAWTVVHGPTLPAFQHLVPYAAGVVELDERVFMVGQIRGCTPDAVQAGLRVHVEFDDVTDEVSLPHWRVADGAGTAAAKPRPRASAATASHKARARRGSAATSSQQVRPRKKGARR